MLQIREEEKKISKLELAKCLGVDQNQINKMISDGLLPQSVDKNRFFPGELIVFLEKWPSRPSFEFKNEYFEDLINSVLVKEQGGIFVVSSDGYPSEYDGMSDMIEKYGIWKAQGLNNHVHLKDIVQNAVHQILLANKVIDEWVANICKLQLPENCVIYWNGSIDSTVCIYLTDKADDSTLDEYDIQLGIEKINVRKISCETL